MWNVQRLVESIEAGAQPDFVFLAEYTCGAEGNERSCLSACYPAPFEFDGVRYATAEHFLMAEKARLFGDEETRRRILSTDSPEQARAFGHKVRGFSADVWQTGYGDIIVVANIAKFEQNPKLWRVLDGTGDAVLVETSALDGVCEAGLAENDERARDPRRWTAQNLLGFSLMEVRRELRELFAAR